MTHSNQPREILFLNGQYMPLAEGKISVEDRGFQFADGVYEVLRVRNGRAFRLESHLRRLRQSAGQISLKAPYDEPTLAEICWELIDRAGLREGMLYMQITRGGMPRRHVPLKQDVPPTVVIYTRALAPVTPEAWGKGVAAIFVPDNRWNTCQVKSIALLPNILATMEAARRGADEAIFFGPDEVVYECASANVWMASGGEVFTHPLGNKILPGITREVILELCQRIGIVCHEVARTKTDFLQADEVFLSSTLRNVMPICAIDGQKIGKGPHLGSVGPQTQALRDLFEELQEQETL